MQCPSCNENQDTVLETRNIDGGAALKRRRECNACGWRYTTFERLEAGTIAVIKRDKKREPFEPAKLRRGIALSIKNLGLDDQLDVTLESIVRDVERLGTSVPSREIGKVVEAHLRRLSPVAYIRFASVFRRFSDPSDFDQNLTELGGHLLVRKRSGALQLFDREKIRRGIAVSAKNTDLTDADVSRLTDTVIKALNPHDDVVDSQQIGRLVLEALEAASTVAYLRFRNVFERFTRPQEFLDALEETRLRTGSKRRPAPSGRRR